MQIRSLAAFALGLSLLAQAQTVPVDASVSEAEAQARLEVVRGEIRALTKALQAIESERDDATRSLRELETAIAASIAEVRAIDDQLAAQQEELGALEQRRSELSASLAGQREALAVLLRSAYALGRSEELKLLLQQEDVGEIARVLAYHRYFQRARVERIDDLLANLNQLADVQQAIEAQNAELDATRARSEQEAEALRGQRGDREAMLAELDQKQDDQKARLALMAKDEKGLVELLERLQDVFADIPDRPDGAEPFARLRGQLKMPVKGKVLVRFGGSDESGRRLSGWLIGAPGGTPVEAIARGRVAYADWLKGYGMLLILDHGDGYMSLYGYNDSLRRDVGDWVSAGEIVATSGSSGGQRSAGLYFELRQQGKAVNPQSWFR